jgi:hypothetical protein
VARRGASRERSAGRGAQIKQYAKDVVATKDSIEEALEEDSVQALEAVCGQRLPFRFLCMCVCSVRDRQRVGRRLRR